MRIICILVTVFIFGCSTVSNYPNDWPQIHSVKDKFCPDISGEYYDTSVGETIGLSGVYDGISLLQLIRGEQDASSFDHRRKIRITQSTKVISFIYMKSETVVTFKSFNIDEKIPAVNNHFSCDGNGIKFIIPDRTMAGMVIPAVGGFDYHQVDIILSKTTDHSLVANLKVVDTGLMIIVLLPVPFRQTSEEWIKWERVKETATDTDK